MTEINYDAGIRAKNAVDELQQMLRAADAATRHNFQAAHELRAEVRRLQSQLEEGLSPIDVDRLRQEVDEFARLGSFLAGVVKEFLRGECTISDLHDAVRFTTNPNDDVGFDIMPLDEVRASLGRSK